MTVLHRRCRFVYAGGRSRASSANKCAPYTIQELSRLQAAHANAATISSGLIVDLYRIAARPLSRVTAAKGLGRAFLGDLAAKLCFQRAFDLMSSPTWRTQVKAKASRSGPLHAGNRGPDRRLDMSTTAFDPVDMAECLLTRATQRCGRSGEADCAYRRNTTAPG